MAVKVLTDEDGYQCLYCTTSMMAFGRVHEGEFDLNDFLEFLPQDARLYTESELNAKYYEWIDDIKRTEVDHEFPAY